MFTLFSNWDYFAFFCDFQKLSIKIYPINTCITEPTYFINSLFIHVLKMFFINMIKPVRCYSIAMVIDGISLNSVWRLFLLLSVYVLLSILQYIAVLCFQHNLVLGLYRTILLFISLHDIFNFSTVIYSFIELDTNPIVYPVSFSLNTFASLFFRCSNWTNEFLTSINYYFDLFGIR